jgi:hypothetical protein
MSVEKKDANPQEDQTMEDEYSEELEETEETEEEPEEDPEEEPEEEPEGEPEEEPEGEPEEEPEEDSEGLQPLDDEPEEGTPVKGEIPFHVLKREREKRQQLERELEEARRGSESPSRVPEPPSEKEAPREADFDDREDYLIAKAKHEFKVEQARNSAIQAEEERQDAIKRRQQTLERNYEGYVADALKSDPEKFKDYEEAENFLMTVGLHGMAIESLMTAEKAPYIVRHLKNKPSEAVRIAELSPLQQVEEIGHLKKRSMVKPTKRRVTKAPAPVKPERGDSSPPKKLKFSKDMSLGDYEKLRKSAGEEATLGDLGLD